MKLILKKTGNEYSVWIDGEKPQGESITKPLVRFSAPTDKDAQGIADTLAKGEPFPLEMEGVEIL